MKRRYAVSVERLESRDTPSSVAVPSPVIAPPVAIHFVEDPNQYHRTAQVVPSPAAIGYYEDPNL